MVGIEIFANARKNAGQLAAGLFDGFRFAGHAIHVSGWPAQIGNDAGKAFDLVADLLDLVQDGCLRAALDDTALMFGDGAESTATEAPAHDIDREADHLPGRDPGIAVGWMRFARIRQVIDVIHFFGGERNRRRIEPHFAVAMTLNQGPRIARVGLQMQHSRSVCIKHRIFYHFFVRRQAHDLHRTVGLGLAHDLDHVGAGFRLCGLSRDTGTGSPGFFQCRLHDIGVYRGVDLARPVQIGRSHLRPPLGQMLAQEGRAADIGNLADLLTFCHAMGQFHQRPFGIAVEQDISLGIDQHRTTHLVRPVVVMRDTAQRGLDTADHQWHIGIGFTATL